MHPAMASGGFLLCPEKLKKKKTFATHLGGHDKPNVQFLSLSRQIWAINLSNLVPLLVLPLVDCYRVSPPRVVRVS